MLENKPSRNVLVALHLAVYSGFALWGNGFQVVHPIFAPILAALLIWISVIDIIRFEIPDLGAGLLALTGAVFVVVSDAIILDHALGAMIWPLLFWFVATGYMRMRGWQGLGFGDVKLMVGIGVWLGFHQATQVVFAAALSGILAVVVFGLMKRKSFADIGSRAVAFGPFLCLSAWVTWVV
ncbi:MULTISPECIES: A24 family peptidase [unclassified Yoonia]|uniref:A24 family peptidase n=1 Tax=unclassified Yoonia TaxID=2629118 RepID=UPI002B0008AF|nr:MULTISPECIES: A24 family peptidase [unclassified Yoonia]